ncbi:MAG: DUF45 domain-containing protein [Proteobacteria bacterium]|jgi:predicted metal-dependent hydrolase|nr:DUF45 domain-containing protein [Pseudomonadota bacterium]
MGGATPVVEAKRRWIYDARRVVNERQRKLLTQKYASGAKLQYRGRWLMLNVQSAPVDEVEIACRSKFHVQVPEYLEEIPRLKAVKSTFNAWLRQRALRDLLRFGRRHEKNLGLKANDYRLGEQKRFWGSCGKDRVIRVHWQLIQAPALAMEYVVAHELVHLIERNHSEQFWALLGQTLSEWGEGKAMLEAWEGEHRAV